MMMTTFWHPDGTPMSAQQFMELLFGILAAWDHTSNLEKMLRLADHIDWAEKHGSLPEVAAFLRKLDESQWHHLGD